MIFLGIFLIIINIIAFFLMYTDKKRAKNKKWRIRESTLFITAIAGGSIGSILGMYTFRHKTKHTSFVVGMPLILVAQILVALAICFYFSDKFQLFGH